MPVILASVGLSKLFLGREGAIAIQGESFAPVVSYFCYTSFSVGSPIGRLSLS
jgi:hypothetical protein